MSNKGHYASEDAEVMISSAKAKNKSRLQELIDFAKVSGFKKIGIANCKGVQKYADKLAEKLMAEGFEVVAVNCRESGLQGCDVCCDLSGACCDPLSQAAYLNEHKTDLNINVGLCLGHGLLFQKYSKAEVTTFLVKSFADNHNVIASLSDAS